MTAATQRVGNVSVPGTGFVDRRVEVAALAGLLATARLITLTGPAGVGKTRLALQVAAQRSRGFPDGVWLVELANVADPALVAHSVGHAVGMRDSTNADPAVLLARFLRARRLLLVLDTCEHLVEACGTLVHGLLQAAPKVRVLATSRETLRVPGEHVVPLGPLPVTEAAPATAVRGGRRRAAAPAVELFAQRAALVQPSFAVTERNRGHVVELCRWLDGLPLAIELAAARLGEVPVEQLRTRLTDRFAVLDADGQDGQRSLRTAVEWSYALCEPAERTLWNRLSIFAGTADLPAIEAVCTDDRVAAVDVLDLVGGLVGKSVLVRQEVAGEVVYRMLDTLRAYGLGRLRQAGEYPRLGQAHADRYLELSEQAERDWFGPRQAVCFRWVRREHANLRAALDFYLAGGATEPALRLAAALWFHWVFSGRVAEGRLWLERALARSDAPTGARAGALWACSLLASQQGELADSTRLAEAAHAVAVQVGDPLTVARAVARLAIVANYRQDPDLVHVLVADAIARYEALGQADNPYVVMALLTLASAQLERGEVAEAGRLCERCATICRSRADRILLANTLMFLAQREWLDGRLDRADGYAREGIRLEGVQTPAHALGQLVDMAAVIAVAAGDARRAAVLLGAAERVWCEAGLEKMMRAPLYHNRRSRCAASARRALGDGAYQVAYRQGRRFSLPDVVDYAAAVTPRHPPHPPPRPADTLTRRERQVAGLVAEGLSNKEIAWRLAIAPRTAESHVERILAKLGLRSRAQVASWATRQRPDPPEVHPC